MASLLIGRANGREITLPSATLLRHVACLGSSGSGKTVACKVICEEAIRAGVPVIAIDPQGDIASFACPAEHQAARDKGVPEQVIREYRERVEPVIWTPGSTAGIPLALDPLRAPPPGGRPEEVIRDRSILAASLAGLVGFDAGSDDGRAAAACMDLTLEQLHGGGEHPGGVARLAAVLDDPPPDLRERLRAVASPALPGEIGRRLRVLDVGAGRLLFSLGPALDIDTLLGRTEGSPGRTRLSVIYLNALPSQEEKAFFLSVLVQELYRWMLSHPSRELQALFYIDEIAPFLPPVRKPACKDALKLLFKQARKYGIGCLLATQNPGDVDYSALSQFSTWNLGRLLTKQDIKKVDGAIKSLDPKGAEAVLADLPSLQAGEFRLLSPDAFPEPVAYQVRWLVSSHRTLEESAIPEFVPDALRERLMAGALPLHAHAPAAGAAAAPVSDAERVVNALKSARAAVRVRDLGQVVGLSDRKVNDLLGELEEAGAIKREKVSASWRVWHADYDLRPAEGLETLVEVARLELREADARKRAQGQAQHSLFGLRADELLETLKLRHHPLWQVHVTAATVRKGWLFSRTETGSETIYIDPYDGQLWAWARRRGFFRVPASEQSPLDFQDLDDVCTFEATSPGRLELHPNALTGMIDAERATELARQKFACTVVRTALVFLPYWFGTLKSREGGKRRFIHLDGVTGLPLDLPDRTRPTAEGRRPSGANPRPDAGRSK